MTTDRARYDVQTLLKMTKPALNELWSSTTSAGDVPFGYMQGTAIVTPGVRVVNRALARHIKTFAWQGKTFREGMLTNRIAGHDVIAALIYKGPSIYDAMECIILDYSETPIVEKLRDELRQLRPGLYLGKAYRNRQELIFFALESSPVPAPSA